MSRLSRSRVAVATGLTLGTATAGLLLAPAAFAAAEPTITVTPSDLKAGDTITVNGTECYDAGNDTTAAAISLDGSDDDALTNAGPTNADGTWTLTLKLPADITGTHQVAAACFQYLDTDNPLIAEYAPVSITVKSTSTGTTAPSTSASPTSAAAEEFKPGAKPNTPGIANTTTSTTTGNAAAPGQKVVKVLKGFQPYEKVTLVLHSIPVTLGTFTADANGVVTAEFTIPAGTPLGNHTLVYSGDKNSYFEDPLTLTKDGKALAYTGADVKLPLIGGTVLLAAGAGALVIGRRRRTEATQA